MKRQFVSFLTASLLALNVVAQVGTDRPVRAKNVKNGSGTLAIPSSGTVTVPNGTDTLVNLTGSQTLANKTLSSSILVTPTTDVHILTEQSSTPATPAAGTKKLYAKDDGKLYTLGSDGSETEVGSGGGGSAGINLMLNQDFESDVSGVTGSGMTVSHKCLPASDGEVLVGDCSLGVSASDAGDYFDLEMAPNPAGLAGQSCQTSFRYMNVTGTTAVPAGAKAYVYNKTTSTVVSDEVTLEPLSGIGTTKKLGPISYSCGAADDELVTRVEATDTNLGYSVDVSYGGEAYSIGSGTLSARDYINLVGYNGYGSTNTKIMRFDSIARSSTSNNIFTYADSATLGASITINRACFGRASFGVQSVNDTSTHIIGLSRNSSQLTTSIGSITASDILANVSGAPSGTTRDAMSLAWFGPLQVGDVIRVHNDGTNPQDDLNTKLSFECTSEINAPVVSQDQADYGPTDYTPSSSPGFGTITVNKCTHARKGKFLLLDCKFTAGTLASGSEARIALPGSLTSVSTISTIQKAGIYVRQGISTSHGGLVLIEPSKNYVTFGANDTFSNTSLNPFAKVNGTSSLGGSSDVFHFDARIEIEGWHETNGAMVIPGSITTGSSIPFKFATALVGGSTVGSSCGSSPCTLYDPQVGISGVVRNSVGNYTVSFTSGYFTGRPNCNVNGVLSIASLRDVSLGLATSSSVEVATGHTGTSNLDTGFIINCWGP